MIWAVVKRCHIAGGKQKHFGDKERPGLLSTLLWIHKRVRDMSTKGSGWQPSRLEVSEFLLTQPTCVFSTVDIEGAPQGATVAFSESRNDEFLIGTSVASRKAANIDRNPHVALTITDLEKRYTVQVEGSARKLTPEEFVPFANTHYDQLPASRPFKDAPGQVSILISPSHIRFSDCSVYPWLTTEFNG